MIVNNFSLFSNIMMKLTSSISSCTSSLVAAQSIGEKIGNAIITFLASLIYTVCKWILYLLDIVFFYVRQISGADVDTSSLESLSSGDSDMVFKMLLSNSDTISQIVKQLTGLTLVVIIVITIIAIIKTQFDAIKDNKPGDNAAIIKRTFKSILLIIITPIIAIGGIMMSNILLKTLYNATNVTGASSLGSSVFSLSSTAANSYRIYAQNGDRIPIFYEFSQQEEYLDQIEQNQLTQKSLEYLTSEDNPAYKTHLMFDGEDYYKFDELVLTDPNAIDNINLYYQTYDQVANVINEEVQRIRAYREEYFVMADVIDFAVKTSSKVYFKTIEEILTAAKLLPDNTYANMLSQYDISVTADYITFRSDYYSYDELNMEAGAVRQIQYVHKTNTIDELYGAIFIVAVEKTKEIGGVTYTYYEPFVEGYRKDLNTAVFESDFIKEGHIVAAKGIFTTDQMPTAIKREKNGTDIIFYRDNLKEYDLGDVAGFAQLYEEATGQEKKSVWQEIKETFQQIFNPNSYVPKLDVDFDAVRTTYKKQTSQEGMLAGGKLHVSYLFNKTDDILKQSKYSLNVKNFFDVSKFNFLFLVMGSFLLLKVCATAIFALIRRIYELFMLFIFYPTSCATMPLDDDTGYKKWITSFIGKLFSTYGLILGINFVLMVAPVMENVQIFSAADVSSSTVIRRLGLLFFNVFSSAQIAKMLNIAVAFLFQLVAFSLLVNSGIVQLMSKLFPGEEDITTNNPATQMAAVVTDMGKVVTDVGKFVTGFGTALSLVTPKGRNKFWQQNKGKLERLVPGSALYNEFEDAKYRHKKKKEQKEALNDLKYALDSSSSTSKEIEEKMNAFLKAQEAYTKTLSSDKKGGSSTRALREAEADTIKQEKKKHLFENSRDGDADSSKESMFDGMSDDEIQNYIDKAQKFTEKNEKKYDKGKLDENETSKFEEAQDIINKGTETLQKRKDRTAAISNLNNRISELEKKESDGTISQEEKNELEKAKTDLKNYESQISREQDAYELKHNKKRRKQYEKEQKRKEDDEKLFKHKAKGRDKRRQKKRLKEMQKEISSAEQDLVSVGIAGYTSKSLDDIKQELANPTRGGRLTDDQRQALQNYYDASLYKQRMINLNDQEYANAAAMNSRKQYKKDENKLAQGGPLGAIRRKVRDGSANKNISDYQDELARIEAQLQSTTGFVDAKTYEQRRKLNERKAFLQSKITQSENWNKNNNTTSIEEIRERRKSERKTSLSEKYTHLTEHAIRYLTENKIPITDENINRYIANVQRGRAMRRKKK